MFFYGREIKTSLVRETALKQSRIIFQEDGKFARSSGRKARRHRRIRPLGGPTQKQTTPACVLKPQALICSPYRVCAHVVHHCVGAHVHINGVFYSACILQCVFICSIFMYISEFVLSCMRVYVCVCLFTYGLCSSSECLILVCVGVFFCSDWCSLVKWVPALQQVTNNSCLLFLCCLFIPDCWVTDVFDHLSVSVFLCIHFSTFNPSYMRVQRTINTMNGAP